MRPVSEAELADAIASAKGPLMIRGGGSRAGLGHRVDGDVLETGGLTGIRLYEPGALTLVAAAGTPLAEVEAALAAEGQMLPFEPMGHGAIYGTAGEPTIGGVVAVNASGPRRIQAGACRDSLIGVRFVDGRGAVLKNGGRVMKNVTGYDLVKLLSGSHGTLGVLSEVAFKLLPRPEAVATVLVDDLTDQDAVTAMSAALTSPYDVTGAAYAGGVVQIRIEGFSGSVAYRAEKLRALLGRFGAVRCDPAHDWSAVRDAHAVAQGEGDIWRMSVKPGDAPSVAARLGAEAHSFDWGGGMIWARVAEGTDLRAKLGPVSGHATLVRAADVTKTRLGVFAPQNAVLTRISAGLRGKFDPRALLNPGRMG